MAGRRVLASSASREGRRLETIRYTPNVNTAGASCAVRWKRKEEGMGSPITVDAYIDLVYGPQASKEALKSKRDTVSRMCRDGVLDAFKAGRRWLIRLEGDDG